MRAINPELNQKRMMTKVAHLYHSRGMVQTEIAKVLGLSQARVSRLLTAAAEANIIRTVVMPPQGLFADLEAELENAFGLLEVHLVDPASDSAQDLHDGLGRTLASSFQISPIDGKTVGLSLSNQMLDSFVGCLEHFPHAKAQAVIQLCGAIGSPVSKHDLDVATDRLARLTSSSAIYLRSPALTPSVNVRSAFAENDLGTRDALAAMDRLDVAIFEIASGGELGAAGVINLRLIDESGRSIQSDRDALLIAATLEQIGKASRRIGVGGGTANHQAVLATVLGGLANVLITDFDTAEFLLEHKPN